MIVTGIFHNYALSLNEALGLMNARKNMIPKFRNKEILVDSKKIDPQKIIKDNNIEI